MNNIAKSRVFLIVAIIPFISASSKGVLTQMEGYYSHAAHLCTEKEGTSLVPCGETVKDCMIIKEIDRNHAHLEIWTVQANGAMCQIDGESVLKGRTLIYSNDDPQINPSRAQVEIVPGGGKLTIRYKGNQGIAAPPFCGANARLDYVEFALADKQPVANHSCAD